MTVNPEVKEEIGKGDISVRRIRLLSRDDAHVYYRETVVIVPIGAVLISYRAVFSSSYIHF